MESRQQEPLANFVVLPPYRNATVAIDPWKYPLSKRPDGKPDRALTYHKLKGGEFYPIFDEVVLTAFREHPGNQANGGFAFTEIQKGVVDHARQLLGGIGASIPEGGITDDDRLLLMDLSERKEAPTMPPNGIKGTFDLYSRAVERFRVAGIRHPKPDSQWPELKVKVNDLIELLAESGIGADERGDDS